MYDNQERDLLGISTDRMSIIDDIGSLLAQHKLVPFFGAGVSRQHLGFAGRELAVEMAGILKKPLDTPLAVLADDYTHSHGQDGFANYLRTKLTVHELDDVKVPIHRLLLSLSSLVLYTTNQDNLFELTAAHYGRPYRPVITLQDLSNAMPGEPTLMKFHGDPSVPESLVFGTKSYEQRIAAERHPLDIRLQSDLLGKRFLFLGYSFQDENVNKLLSAVKRVFGGNMPQSYLVAFEYDPSMQKFADDYGVEVLDPVTFFDAPITPVAAFERVLAAMCDSTIRHQAARGLDAIFDGGEVNRRMVTDYELDGLSHLVETDAFSDAVAAFRGLIDQARIPTSLLERCTELFRRLTERADPKDDGDMGELKGMLFNFCAPPASSLLAMAYVMAACNRRPRVHGFDEFSVIICPVAPPNSLPIAAAMAVALLRERNETITDSFRNVASAWFRGFADVPAAMLDNVKSVIEEAWPGDKASQSPLNRPQLSFKPKEFHSILKDMEGQWPKKFQTPKE
jgi:hypothetical protein